MGMVGKSVMMVGCAASAGAKEILDRRLKEFEERYALRYLKRGRELLEKDTEMSCGFALKEAEVSEEAKEKGAPEIRYDMFGNIAVECGEKGVFGGLWRLAESAGCGLCIEQEKIPVLQIAIELCDYDDISVYEADSTGVKLFLSDNSGECRKKLNDMGITACEIGYTTDSRDRVVRNGEITRFLTPDYRH